MRSSVFFARGEKLHCKLLLWLRICVNINSTTHKVLRRFPLRLPLRRKRRKSRSIRREKTKRPKMLASVVCYVYRKENERCKPMVKMLLLRTRLKPRPAGLRLVVFPTTCLARTLRSSKRHLSAREPSSTTARHVLPWLATSAPSCAGRRSPHKEAERRRCKSCCLM